MVHSDCGTLNDRWKVKVMTNSEDQKLSVKAIEKEVINALPNGAKLSDIVAALANVIKQIAEIWDVAHQDAIDQAKTAATADQQSENRTP